MTFDGIAQKSSICGEKHAENDAVIAAATLVKTIQALDEGRVCYRCKNPIARLKWMEVTEVFGVKFERHIPSECLILRHISDKNPL